MIIFFWEGTLSTLATGARRQTAAAYLELPQTHGGVGLPNLQAVLDDCTTSKVLRWSLQPHCPNSIIGHAQLQTADSNQVHCLPLVTNKVRGTTSWHYGYNILQKRLKQAQPPMAAYRGQYEKHMQELTWHWSSNTRCHWETQGTRSCHQRVWE